MKKVLIILMCRKLVMSKTIAAVIILAFLCGFTYLAYSEDDGEKVYTIPRGVYLDPDGNEGAVEITLRGKDGRALTVEEALEHAKTIQVTGERFDGGVTTPGGSKIDEGIGYIMPDGSLEGVQDVYGNPTTIEEHIKLLEEMQKAERGEKRASEFSEISEAQQTLLEHKKAIEERKSARKFKVTGQKKPRFSEFYEVEEMVEEVEKSEEQQSGQEEQVEKKQRAIKRVLISSAPRTQKSSSKSLVSVEKKEEEKPAVLDKTEIEENLAVQQTVSFD